MENVKSKEGIASYQNEYQQGDETTIEFGDTYPYLQIDLSRDAEKIAQEMVEGYNYPGTTKPMPFDSSSLPEGWQKSVIRRTCADGRWEVLISHTAEGAKRGYFHKKSQIDNYLKKHNLPYNVDIFVFCLDDQLKQLKRVWRKYISPKTNDSAKNAVASLKEHVKMNPIPFLKKELISPKKSEKSNDISNDQNMLQLKNLGVYDNYLQLANENEEINEYLNVDTEITPIKSKKRAVEKSDSDSGIDEAKRLKTEKMWDEMMFNDDWILNQDNSTGQLISE